MVSMFLPQEYTAASDGAIEFNSVGGVSLRVASVNETVSHSVDGKRNDLVNMQRCYVCNKLHDCTSHVNATLS